MIDQLRMILKAQTCRVDVWEEVESYILLKRRRYLSMDTLFVTVELITT